MGKSEYIQLFFAKQCSLIETGSELPAEYLLTHYRLELVNLDPAKILSIICAFNNSKAHGWDNVSVCMVNICDESLVKPLFNIFQFLLETGNFPSNWKRGNIVQVHKKGNKDLINNYRPMSLLPIFSKIYEKCIYDTLYNYFEGNDLFSKNQSGFRKGDSCVSQLLFITHKILKGFDANPSLDTCGIFLDISKIFDRVWHDGLIFKLRSYGISDSLLRLFNSFLSERLQTVVLNGQASEWQKVLTGVPQGSILGTLLFLISINDIPANLECNVKIFADDTSLFSLVHDPNESSAKLGRALGRVARWVHQWKMSFNPDPSKQAVEVHFSRKINPVDTLPVYFNNLAVATCETHKHLGLLLDKRLAFDRHEEK